MGYFWMWGAKVKMQLPLLAHYQIGQGTSENNRQMLPCHSNELPGISLMAKYQMLVSDTAGPQETLLFNLRHGVAVEAPFLILNRSTFFFFCQCAFLARLPPCVCVCVCARAAAPEPQVYYLVAGP